MALTPGTRIGSYEIAALIGKGGMGEVYRATDTNLARQVAIKVLPEAVASDAERLARFDREAKTLAALNHPNIAIIHGLEKSAGTTALVMELVEGDTIAERLQASGSGLPVDEALAIATQIAEALEAAHEKGVIHRDLKPANVKVTSDGTVKVLDFGLAKAMEPTGASPSASMSPTITTPAMTQAGMILGTAAYMSPEQARGRPVDKRADIWAFGVVLYEMLTGHRAFEGEDVADTLGNVMKVEPAWERLPASVPARVDRVLRACLCKPVKERLDSAQAVRLALEGAFDTPASAPTGAAVTVTAVAPLWRRALPLATAVLVTGVIVGVGVRVATPVEPRPVVRSTHLLPDGRAFFNIPRSVVDISPDGRRIAYNGSDGIYVRSLDELEDRLVSGLDALLAAEPSFSPDGQSLAFLSANLDDLRRISFDGGASRSLASAGDSFGISWESDGSILYGQADGIWQVSENGGEPQRIIATGAEEVPFGPRRLPRNDWVLFSLARLLGGPSRWDEAQIVVASAGSGERRVLRTGGNDARYLPTGHLVYAQGAVLYAVPFDVDRLEGTGSPVPVVQGVRRAANPANSTGAANYAVSDNGTLIYVPGPVSGGTLSTLAWVDAAGRRSAIEMPPGEYQHPRVSPDGRWLAVERLDGPTADIWLYEVAGTSAERRLTEGGNNRYPVWSRNSQWVVFQSDREGDRGIFRQRVDGTGVVERLTTADEGVEHVPEDWSPVAERLAVSIVSQGGVVELWTWSVPEGSAERVGSLRSGAPFDMTYSPDGAWFAYTERLGGVATYLQPVTGQNRYQIGRDDDLAHHPLWLPEGNRLVYFPGGNAAAVVMDVSTEPTVAFGRPEPVPGNGLPLNVTPTSLLNHDVGPDGRFVTVLSGTGAEGSPIADQIVIVEHWFEELKRLVPVD